MPPPGDVDLDGAVCLVAPAQYYTLMRNDKLVSAEYSTGNGNYADGKVLKSNGIPIVKTNRIIYLYTWHPKIV